MKHLDYKPEVCTCCGQSTTYVLPIDNGAVTILKAVARAIGDKGINCVHVNKELVGKYLTPLDMTNMTRPRAHGLIAKVKGDGMKGNYLLTTKGAQFLRGERVPKYALMSKVEGHQIGYLEPDIHTVTINDFLAPGQKWEGIGYEIVEGRVVKAPVVPATLGLFSRQGQTNDEADADDLIDLN